MSIETLAFTFSALRDAYRGGTPPEEVVNEVFRRIEAANDPAMFIHLDREAALAAARALGAFDETKPLWGLPFAVKDNIDVAGMPTTAACPAYAYRPDADAFVVAHLRQAGAIPVGKTNLDQFATGLVGVRSPYGVPVNAIDPEIVPGGSSSGSAVAVARGIVPFALGTDTAGSGRVPAALNNIVGLKPTLGTLSATGMVPACRTLDTISVFALAVEDAFAAFSTATAYDEEDAYSRVFPKPSLGTLTPRFTIGVPDLATRKFFGDEAQAESFAQAVETVASLGGKVVELDFSVLYAIADMLYEGAWVAERYAAIEAFIAGRPDALFPVTNKIIGGAAVLSAADAFNGYYRLMDLKRAAEPLLKGIDMLCVPTIPRFFSRADLDADPIGPNSKLGTYTNFVNLMDMCAIAVPMAVRGDGRPGSVTLLAAAGRDGSIAALASKLHQHSGVALGATSWELAKPESASPRADDDEIAVALVGAHMSGLPLNSEITDRGGRFMFAGETAPVYGFYALAGGPPKRPGLVRRDTGGTAIPLEVWALPKKTFGDFLAGIPSPLCIGTVQLSDGASVKGFICEDAGTAGAEDISALGGWRRYLERV